MQLLLLVAWLFLALCGAGRRARADVQVVHEEERGHATAHPRGTHETVPVRTFNVCGNKCCVGWIWSPKTRSCTKPRCLPRCHNGAVCRSLNRCVCRPAFHGHRCQFSSASALLGSVRPTALPRSSVMKRKVAVNGNTPATKTQSDTGLKEAFKKEKRPEERENEEVNSTESSPSAENEVPLITEETLAAAERTDETLLKTQLQDGLNLKTAVTPETQQEAEVHGGKQESRTKEGKSEEDKRKQTLSVREVQSVLLRKAVGGRGDKMAALLMRHIERERSWLRSVSTATGGLLSNVTTVTSGPMSEKTFHSQRGQYTVHISSDLCPLLCKNGGLCLQKDRCLCPPNFTGKFCQLPVSPNTSPVAPSEVPPSTNDIIMPALLSANQELRRSEFVLPLGSTQDSLSSRDPSPNLVKVSVQHPPEASVKVHQVLKVSGSSARSLGSTSGSAGAPAPVSRGIQSQTVRGSGTYSQFSGFKYCFREVQDGQCSSPLPGLRSRDTCCRGIGKAWGITDCELCPSQTGKGNSSCPTGFEQRSGKCEAHSVISEDKSQCFRILGPGSGPSSCSLPILRSITKQICCCSRVGKAWGPDCERCPYFGSVAFKEICPAGPGYHYSASALQFNQRAIEQLGHRGAPLLTPSSKDTPDSSPGSGSSVAQSRPSPPEPGSSRLSSPVQPSGSATARDKPQTPGRTHAKPQAASVSEQGHSRPPSQPKQTVAIGNTFPALPRPQSPITTTTTKHPVTTKMPPRAPRVHSAAGRGACETRPGVCGRGRCVNQPNGRHICVCYHGYQPNAHNTTCQDMDECRQSVCGSNARCENTPGSYRCVCGHGYRLRGNTCTDIDECEDPLLCPGQECVNSPGSYRCVSCPPGHGLLNRVCADIDECRQAPCSNGRCENSPGSYRCICRHGYRLHNNTCTDVDECLEPSQCPGQTCVNTAGSYRCVSCRPGYTLHNRQCIDIDECEERDACGGQPCVNSEGSFSCVSCSEGYRSVNGICSDVDECLEPSRCPGQTCVNTAGSYRCVSCRPGYSHENGSCQDVDECVSPGACESDRVCVNTVGSFRCDCPPGYGTSGLGRQCRDINECVQSDLCRPRGQCVNTPGSFTCVCSQGFTLSPNSSACIDLDECELPGLCADGRCVNSEGSYHCTCNSGFTPNPERTACLDVDECVSSGGSVCGTQRCENTIGSYHCLTSCKAGHQVSASGSCVDINECSDQTVCGEHAFCQNLIGTYMCVCDQGFSSTADGKSCADEDECVSLPGVCGSARCENVQGSFMCECDRAGEEFDPRAKKCLSTAPKDPSSSSPAPQPLPRPGELRECYYNLSQRGTCSILSSNSSLQECCCTAGQGWGLDCQHQACPHPQTEEFQTLCPNGRGYVTTGPGAFDYRDVDECKRFGPEVCKNGVCVNNIPGFSCYCPSGYVYNSTVLECIDHDECEEESCVGGVCINTVGSYYCSCPHPLVLDDTQHNCVNASHLELDENVSFCWQHVSADLLCQSPLHGAQLTFTDCCCLYGEGWGMECALCPTSDSEDYASLCSSVHSPVYPDSYPDSASQPGARAGAARGGAAAPYFPPYSSPDLFPPAVDYEDSAPVGGARGRFDPGFRGRSPAYGGAFYSEPDFAPDESRLFGPDETRPFSPDGSRPFLVPPDPRSEQAFAVQPPPPSGPSSYRDDDQEEEEPWRAFPPFNPRAEPRRVYDRRYEAMAAAEDCGILHGCENGHCIRVSEGYTCDCYHGYELDLTSMTCVDVNECGGIPLDFPCVNARCVNTDGSFRCVCRRGYILSHRPNHCVAA